MTDPKPDKNDEPLDLEASQLCDAEHPTLCSSDDEEATDDSSLRIDEPQTTRRCDASQREIAQNHFPVEL